MMKINSEYELGTSSLYWEYVLKLSTLLSAYFSIEVITTYYLSKLSKAYSSVAYANYLVSKVALIY